MTQREWHRHLMLVRNYESRLARTAQATRDALQQLQALQARTNKLLSELDGITEETLLEEPPVKNVRRLQTFSSWLENDGTVHELLTM